MKYTKFRTNLLHSAVSNTPISLAPVTPEANGDENMDDKKL